MTEQVTLIANDSVFRLRPRSAFKLWRRPRTSLAALT
jgi:hypothetical protein